MAKKKKRSSSRSVAQPDAASDAPTLSSEEQAARREQQKREWAAQKRKQERAQRSAAPFIWGGLGAASLAGVIVLGIVFFAGGGGDGSSSPTPVPTRDPRLGSAPVAQTVTVDANDQGQNVNPTFSKTTITGKAGDVIEIDVNNIGTVHHNLAVAGLDGEYGTPDDWITDPQSIPAGGSGKLLVKFDTPGTFPFHCDFHPDAQKGTLIIS